MSLIISKLPRDEILLTNIVYGQIFYATDTKEVYYDNPDGTRMITTSIVPLLNDTEKDKLTFPESNKVYLVLSSSKIYAYAGEWVRIKDIIQVSEIILECTNLVPVTMKEGNTNIAPATVAYNVFTADGQNVEAILAEMATKYNLGAAKSVFSNESVIVLKGETEIEIPVPFENYLDSGNTFLLYIDNKLVLEYYINDNVVTLGSRLQNDGIATFVFMYSVPNQFTGMRLNGTQITPYSIPTNRLQSITNNINSDSDITIPSSKALYTLKQQVDSIVSDGNPVITTKMAVTTANVNVVTDSQCKFKIPYPFDNYMELGNTFLVFNGGLFVDPSRYRFVSDEMGDCIILSEFYGKRGDTITFIFLYNTMSGNGALSPDSSVVTDIQDSDMRFKELYFNNNGYIDIAYGNGLFVTISSVKSNEMIMTSTDGEEWTRRVVCLDNIWTSICFGNDTFVAVGFNNEGKDCVAISSDGINWESRAASENSSKWIDVAYGNKTFVAVAEMSVQSRKNIMVSVDNGKNWMSVRNPVNDTPKKIIYGNNQFVIICDKYILTSSNGINWSTVEKSVLDICYKDGRFFYIYTDENNVSYFGYTIEFDIFKESSLREGRYPRQIYCADNRMYIFCNHTGSSNDIIITDGFNLLNDTIITSIYEYNKFKFAYGNGLLIGIHPTKNVAVVSGSPKIPELYKILSK